MTKPLTAPQKSFLLMLAAGARRDRAAHNKHFRAVAKSYTRIRVAVLELGLADVIWTKNDEQERYDQELILTEAGKQAVAGF